MTARLTLLAAAALAAPAAAQDLPVALPDQATWTMTVEHTRERTRQNTPPQSARSISTSDVDWRAGAEGGVITLRLRSAELDPPGPTSSDVNGLLNQPVILDVDPSLAPTAVRNWPQVRKLLEQAIDKAVADPAVASATKGVFSGLSPDQAAAAVSREWSLATLSQGTALKLGEPVVYEDSLPNPLGGPPIKTEGVFELTAYDPAAGRAVVAWRQAFDPQSAKESLGQTVIAMTAQLAPDKAKEAAAALADMQVRREEDCRHEIDIPTGLALKVVCTSAISTSVQGETATNIDRWTITQTRPQSSAKTN